jgi:4-carboxymuconolactone decarboxylase
MTEQSRKDAGMAVRRAVLGDQYVDAAAKSEFGGPLQDLVTEYCWGSVWAREGLDRRTRSLINLGILIALNRPHEFKLHLRGALNNGCTREEIQEALLQTAPYCGFPAAVDAFRQAEAVFAEEASNGSSQPITHTGEAAAGHR